MYIYIYMDTLPTRTRFLIFKKFRSTLSYASASASTYPLMFPCNISVYLPIRISRYCISEDFFFFSIGSAIFNNSLLSIRERRMIIKEVLFNQSAFTYHTYQAELLDPPFYSIGLVFIFSTHQVSPYSYIFII